MSAIPSADEVLRISRMALDEAGYSHVTLTPLIRWIWHREHLRVEPVAEPQSDEAVLQQMGREIAGREQ